MSEFQTQKGLEPSSESLEERKARSKGNKLKKAGATALTASSIVSFLGQDVFARSKEKAEAEMLNESQNKPSAVREVNAPGKALSFQEFIDQNKNRGLKFDLSDDQILSDTLENYNAETNETSVDGPIILAGYYKDGQYVSREKGASDFELTMKRNVREMLSYISDAEDDDDLVLSVSANITRSERPRNYSEEHTVDQGTVQELVNEKNPKAGAIVNIVTGLIRGQGGRLGQYSQQADDILYSRIREAKYQTKRTETLFYNLSSKGWVGSVNKAGKPDFAGQDPESFSLTYGIKTEYLTIQYQGLDGSWYREDLVSYSLVGAESLVNQGLVALDEQDQFQAFYADDGKMPKEVIDELAPGLVTYQKTQGVKDQERINQYLVLAAQNKILLSNYGKGETNVSKRIKKVAADQQAEIVRLQQEKEAKKQEKKNKKH